AMMRQARRDEILRLVRKLAAENGGVAPGLERFSAETGIKRHDWGAIWRAWGDVLIEAGFQPNTMKTAYDENALMDALRA
ncbi:hypothetical protein J8J40_34010, partial [Mycobacterium tuberculosis]|nr:hypothetical protein [Mycobacterium tuberculosis]